MTNFAYGIVIGFMIGVWTMYLGLTFDLNHSHETAAGKARLIEAAHYSERIKK